jgi:HEAT repeat protein
MCRTSLVATSPRKLKRFSRGFRKGYDMRRELGLLIWGALLCAGASGCGGISECGEDGARCADMLVSNADKCAIAFQLQQGDPKRKACENAIKVVSKAQNKAATPALLQILQAQDSSAPYDNHRQLAARALADMKETAAVEALIGSLDISAGTSGDQKDKNANRSNEIIAEALGDLGDKKACPKLIELMKKSRNDYVVLKAVRSLGKIACKEAIEPLSEVALKHDNKFMRKNAVQALGDIGDPTATDTLIQMMFVEYQGVSFYREASFALFQIGPSVAQPLLDLMAGKNEAVNRYFEKSGGMKDTAIKAKAGFVLGDLRDPRAVDPLMEAFKSATTGGDPVLAVYSAAPLGALGDKRAVPLLKQFMLTLDASQRDPIMRALVQLGDRSVVPEMVKGMTVEHFVAECTKQGAPAGITKEDCAADKASQVGAQKAAVDHVTNLAGAEHADLISKTIAAEKEEKVREYLNQRAVRVKAAAECKSDAACWSKKLTDSDPLIREKAAWELSFTKDPNTIDALAKALNDKDTFVRSAVIAAYWTYGDKRAVPMIEKILVDDEGQATYVKVNEDLKRLLVHLKRQA